MRVTEAITLQVYVNDLWVDFTDGLIDAEIIRGVQNYAGPLTQPDVGQITIKSRNANLDPYNNDSIRYNTQIRLDAGSERIFTGRIEGINVDYQPQGNPPIVTINAIDIIGNLYKYVLPDEFIDDQTDWTTLELLNALPTEIPEFDNPVKIFDSIAYANAPISTNTNSWDAITQRTKTDIGFIFATSRNQVEYYRLDKDDPTHPYNLHIPKATFDYYGNGESYKRISLSDGFERIMNQVSITQLNGSVVTSSNDNSVDLWGKSSAQFSALTNNLTYVQSLANEILQEMSEPFRDIYEITWDGMTNVDIAKDIDIFDNVLINHKVNETTTINRKYSVIGIKHEIDAENWLVTYTLRNFAYQASSIENPIISVTPASGTTTDTFQFSYTHPNPELIVSQYWDLDDGFTSTALSPSVNYTLSGGKIITLTINTVYGYTKTSTINLSVASAPPVTTWTYTKNADNLYTFTFTGQDAVTYSWNFGDGTTSNLPNPTKYYTTIDPAGELKTITLTTSNAVGTTSQSQTFTVYKYAFIPVKYVRIRFTSAAGNGPTGYKDLRQQTVISNDYIRNMTFGGPTPAFTIEDFQEFNGFFTYDQYNLDSYNRHKRVSSDNLLSSLRYNSATLYPFYNVYSNQDTNIASYITINLNGEYTNLGQIKFTCGSFKTYDPAGKIWIDVSYDNTTFYQYGYGYINSSGTTSWYYTSGTTSPKWTLPTAPGVASYDKIRYARFDFAVLPASSSYRYVLNEIIPFSGTGSVEKGSFTWTNQFGQVFTYKDAIDEAWGLGLPSSTQRTGCTIMRKGYGGPFYDYYYSPTGTPPSTIAPTYIYINNDKNGINSDGSIPSIMLNSRYTKSTIEWEENLNQGPGHRFLIDFGQPLQKLTGFYIDMRNVFGNTVTIPDAMTVTITTSFDGINWTSRGTHSLSPTSTDTGAIRIKTNDSFALTPTSTMSAAPVGISERVPISP